VTGVSEGYQPLFFHPLLKPKVWGGRSLETLLGKQLPPDVAVGESWELSGVTGDISRIANGLHAGVSFSDYVSNTSDAVGGGISTKQGFPLLFKFIDAHDRLSVQVHPDDASARKNGWGSRGKTECWYILHAEPHARIIAGFNTPTTKEEVRRACLGNSLESLLNVVDISTGDLIYIPAGTVHANLPGTVLFEVQQSSDATLRLYDWGRNDPARPLHLDDALQVLDTSARHDYRVTPVALSSEPGYRVSLRIACEYFFVEQHDVSEARDVVLTTRHSCRIITLISGSCTLFAGNEQNKVDKGTTVFLPAGEREIVVRCTAESRMLVTWIPPDNVSVPSLLRDLNVPENEIDSIQGKAVFRQS